MCGRLNVTSDPVAQWLMEALDVPFHTTSNADLRPTQQVDVLANHDGNISQFGTQWGIKPAWSKKLLINAKAETAAEKTTFKAAFHSQRCVVPCTGWYEWRDEGGPRKQKYSFTHADKIPFLMGGIYFNNHDSTELVTLTTQPNQKCAGIHHRMPVLIHANELQRWLQGSVEDVMPLIGLVADNVIDIHKA